MNLSSDIRRGRKAATALVAALILGLPGHAHAVELDYAKISQINQYVNAEYSRIEDQNVCGAVAVNKAFQLMQLYPAADISIDIITDQRGQMHAVAEVHGEIKGKPGAYILDSHFAFPQFRADLEAAGYRWVQKFSGPAAKP